MAQHVLTGFDQTQKNTPERTLRGVFVFGVVRLI
jgi:hypothetical protein